MRVVTGLQDFLSQAVLEVRVQPVARYSKAQSVSVHTHVFYHRNLRFLYIRAHVYVYIFPQSFFTDQQVPHWLPAHTINFLKWPLRQFSDEAVLTLGTVEHQESWGQKYKARISYKERACFKEQTKQDGCSFDSFGFLQMAFSLACFGGAGVVWKEGPVRVSSNWISSFFFFEPCISDYQSACIFLCMTVQLQQSNRG